MSFDSINPTQATAAVAATGSAGARTGSAAAQPAVPAAQTGAPVPAASADAAVKAAELEAARQAANKALKKNGCELAFELDDASGRMIARLIDTKTREVLRQLPSRETLAIAKALAEERSNGVLLQTNA